MNVGSAFDWFSNMGLIEFGIVFIALLAFVLLGYAFSAWISNQTGSWMWTFMTVLSLFALFCFVFVVGVWLWSNDLEPALQLIEYIR